MNLKNSLTYQTIDDPSCQHLAVLYCLSDVHLVSLDQLGCVLVQPVSFLFPLSYVLKTWLEFH